MKTTQHLVLSAALAACGVLGGNAAAQDVGSYLYDGVELEDLTATSAAEFGDFQGRAVLIEFFAYW